MIDILSFLRQLQGSGVEKIAGVPCSFLGPLINAATNQGIYEPFTNEGDAASYAAGHALAGKKVAVALQNSGLSNALSPLSSLNELFGLHVLLIVGNRGEDDEPQHRIMAGAVKPFLNALNIPFYDAESGSLDGAFSSLKDSSVAILVNRKDCFSHVEAAPVPISDLPLRYDVLKAISATAGDAVIVTTTGFTSREMFCIHDRDKNFYMVGSMGCLSSLALGIAESLPHKKVIAIDGDSACLMRLGALYTLTDRAPDNLCYVVLDNGANESTGGQPNAKGPSRLANIMSSLYETKHAKRTDEVAKLIAAFFASSGFVQVHVPIKLGSMKGLPRPDRKLIFDQASRFANAVAAHK